MKEILIFGLSENQGGIETYLKKIWDNIDHKCFHYNFIDMTGEGNKPCFYDELISSGATFFKVTPRNVSVIKNRRDINQLFKKHHFDILHFNVNSMSYVYPIKAARRHNVLVLVHSRNGGTTLGVITKLFHYLNKLQIHYSNVTRIAVSRLAGEWLFGKSPFTVFNNGVDVNRFAFKQENRDSIRTAFACNDKHVIGNVGAFLPAKNHLFIIDVFEKLIQYDDSAVLWLVGEGPGMGEIRKLVDSKGLNNRVIFLGKRNDIPSVYAGMDCFFFPSLYEGFPNAVLEAECEGLPCVLSDSITSEVMVGKNVRSLSLNSGVGKWVDALQKALTVIDANREQAFQIIQAGGFSTVEEIKRLEDLYERL